MGSGRFDSRAYASYSSATVGKSTDEIYSSRGLQKELDPKGVTFRESRDSEDNPNSTPIIVGIDVTGSMGMLADVLARKGLDTLFNSILDSDVVDDPHVMFMAIGDANYDRAPLQVSQFEADNRIVEQLTQIWIEHGGGGNRFESYNLPWYFAGNHTVHDAMEKRGKRGFLFTVGDEEAPRTLTQGQIERFCGDSLQADVTPEEALADAQRLYHVFHIIVEEGHHAKNHPESVWESWTKMLGQNVIRLADHTKLAETISGAIKVTEGLDVSDATRGWDAQTVEVVSEAVKGLPQDPGPAGRLEGPNA